MAEYRIGEFAQQLGVSSDILKYYEKHGGISFRRDEENGYRYCDFDEIRNLFAVKSCILGDLTLGLDDASASIELLPEDIQGTLKSIVNRTERRLVLDRYLLARAREFMEILEVVPLPGGLGPWRVEEGQYLFLAIAQGSEFLSRSAAELRELGKWWQCCPIASLAAKIRHPEDAEAALEYGFIVPTAFAKEYRLSHAFAEEYSGIFFSCSSTTEESGSTSDMDASFRSYAEGPLALAASKGFHGKTVFVSDLFSSRIAGSVHRYTQVLLMF